MATAVYAAHCATYMWFQHRAAGHDVTLLQVAAAVTHRGHALPALPHGDVWVRVLLPTQDDLLRAFRDVRGQLDWSRRAPASALDWAVVTTLREWRAHAMSPCRFDALPRRWTADRPAELHLNNAVQPVDDVTLEIAGLGGEALVEADLFLLPTAYHDALWFRQRTRLGREAARLAILEQAAYDHGSVDAARELLQLRARYAASGLDLDGQTMPPALPAQHPRCRDRAVLREVDVEGRRRWEVVWSFRVPRPTPWRVDDVLGIDPGQRHTWAYASGTECGVIPRAVITGWTLPPLPLDAGLALQGERRALALARRAVFRRMWPGHQQLLDLALSHRVCGVEAVQWSGFRWNANNYATYASDSGVGIRAVLGWLSALAPLHGVTVIETPPQFSSRTCSRCGWVGVRPGAGRAFSCRCGHREFADINAARIHRQRALALLAERASGR